MGKTDDNILNREWYHMYFEKILQPYFKSNSHDDGQARRDQLNKVFDDVVAHGMECLNYYGEIDYHWDEKNDSKIEIAPGMMASYGDSGEPSMIVSPTWGELHKDPKEG